ncbi:MAG: ROK family transcriptional regulator [Spirochaetota bacterium]
MTTGGQAYQKSVNISLIMRVLRQNPGISRTGIAARTGLTKSTVTNLVRELMALGLLVEADVQEPSNGRTTGSSFGAASSRTGASESGGERTGGRPRVGLRIAAESHLVAGVELRPEGFDAVVQDLAGTTLAGYRHFRPGRTLTLRSAFGRAFDVVSKDYPQITAVGVALPATVNPVQGVVLNSTSFGLAEPAFREAAEVPEDLPILIENDANAVAWGAVGHESAGPAGDLLAVVARFGCTGEGGIRVGTGLVLNGRVYHGSGFSAGEFHSAPWRLGDPGELSRRSERELRPAVAELFESLGVAVSMLRPRRLVYAGDLVEHAELIASLLSQELSGSAVDPDVSGCPIEPSREGDLAVAAGAAAMFRERLFALPAVDEPRPRELPRWEQMGGARHAPEPVGRSEEAG